MSDRLFKLALKARADGDNSAAIRLLNQHLSEFPDDLYAKHNLAAAYCDTGRYAESAQIMQDAINSGLNKAPCWLVLARAFMYSNKTSQAEHAYKQVLSFDQMDITAHKELAQLIWMAEGNYERAIAHLSSAIDAAQDSTNLQILRAELAGQMDNAELQYTLMKTCFVASNKQAPMYFYLSKAALAANKYAEALDNGRVAAKSFANDLQCSIHMANCFLANSDPSSALNIVESLLPHFPQNQHLIALQTTCWRWLKDERYEEYCDYNKFVQQRALGVPKGWANLESYIDQLESELEDAHTSVEHPFFLSVRHGSQISSINTSSTPAMKAFEEATNEPLNAYISSLQKGVTPVQSRNAGKGSLFSTWSVKLHSGGHHVNHVHQEGWLSSACHIRTPSDLKDKSGWLKLGEPGPSCVPKLEPDVYVQPKRGEIVIFPSYFWHGTVPFSDEKGRLTVATDFNPS